MLQSPMSSLSPSLRLDTLPPGAPQLTLGPGLIAWGHRWLVQPNGPLAGRPWMPTARQARFLLWWYAVDSDGRWIFNHGARRLAKGSGKSPFAGVLSVMEFCGPARVADIDHHRGQVLAKPVDMPLVEIAATAESQTANTMRMVRAFAKRGSALQQEYELDVGKQVFYAPATGGELHIITSSATAAEGSESTFVVGDETEHWLPSNGGKFLASTLEDNLAKSGSRMLETSNSWRPGTESVAEDTWGAWVAQEEGRVRGSGRVLYDAVVAPHDTDLADEGSLTAALEHVYRDCPWVDIGVIRDKIWSPKTAPDDARRKYLNQPTASLDSWTTVQLWGALADPSIVVADQDEVALFFDGSKSRDATALSGCRISDGHVFTVGVWERPPGVDDWLVPVAEVESAVARAFDRYKVLGFFADVREWESFAKVSWPKEFGAQLVVQAEGGRDPQPIAWDMRGHVFDFTKACELVEAEIRERGFTHDGNAAMARHVANARRRPNRWGVSVGKETPDSPHKIDACVTMIGARMVRRLVVAAKPTNSKPPARIWGA